MPEKRGPGRPPKSAPKREIEAVEPVVETPEPEVEPVVESQIEPMVDLVSEKLDPIFDHRCPTTECREDGRRYLRQQDRRWSFAEFNKNTNEWSPTPHLLDNTKEDETSEMKIMGAIKTLRKALEKIMKDVETLDAMVRGYVQ